MLGQVWAVIPTYNERENIRPVVQRLRSIPDVHMLIVDDHSPDGTGQIADEMSVEWPNVQVLHRPAKQGLGPAYRQGLQQALDAGATAVIHLDADLSHDISKIPIMLEKLQTADLVIGSRYARGGHIHIAPHRQWISVGGNRYLQWLLGREIADWSSGFKVWRAELLRHVLSEHLVAQGYACLMEMTWWAKKHGANIVEIPFDFSDRQAGQSKFTWSIMREDVQTSWRLRRST